MFTQPTVNQIASTYKGNPAPLNAKVEADKKQNGGIPQDLRQLMAAYDLSQGRQNMGIQQALQVPTNMPTVAQDVQERARQALQARMMQQAQEQQRKNGQPNIVPPGTPRPPMQAQGLDSLESNVGEEYAEGGIIGFDGTKSSFVKDIGAFAEKLKGAFTETEEEKAARMLQQRIQQEGAPIGYFTKGSEDYDKKSALRSFLIDNPSVVKNPEFQANPLAFMEKSKNVNTAKDVNLGKSSYVPSAEADAMETNKLLNLAATPSAPAVPPTKVSAPKPTTTQATTRVNADTAPMPGGLKDLAGIPSMGVGRAYERDRLREDPAKAMADLKALYDKEVGARDLSIYDKTAAELEARKQKLNAPKAGYDAMMEYLEQVAMGGGRTSAESGSIGASRQRSLQKERLSQQDLLMDKILELGAKKSDAQFAEKKGMFDLTQAEKNRIIKDKQAIAQSLGLSEDKERELIQQALENELNRKNQIRSAQIGAQDRDNLMSRARALMAADPTKKMTLDQAMQRAGEIANAGAMEGAGVRNRKAYDEAIEKLNSDLRYMPIRLDKKNDPKLALLRTEYENKIKELQGRYGVTGQGLNALPTSTGLPAGVTVTQVK